MTESFVDIENLIAVPPDVVGDVFMELYGLADVLVEDVVADVDEDLADDVGEDLADDVVADVVVVVADVLVEDVVADVGEDLADGVVADADAEVAIASPEQCVEVAVTDAEGYISCALPPLGERGVIGRLTHFPKGVALDKTNIGIRCYLHADCSVTRRAHNISADRMRAWLFNGVPGWGDDAADHKRSHGIRATALL